MAELATIESGLVVVTDPVGDFILHERPEGQTDAEMYQFIGGHAEPDDADAFATALREFDEETNIAELVGLANLDVRTIRDRVRWLCASRSEEYLVGLYAVQLPMDGLELAEGQGGRLVTVRNELTVIQQPDVPLTRFARRVLELVVQGQDLPEKLDPGKYGLAA